MNSIRIIPRLDIKGPNVVKGVHLEGLRILGRPEVFAPCYYEKGADEIIYIDTVASLYGRNNLADIVSRAAEHIYIPLTVGGGIRSLEDIKKLLRAGADKVAVNTAALKNPALITEAAQAFGSQCIVVYIEAKQRAPGQYECLTDNAREKSGVGVFEWAERVAGLGAGEILLTSVDRDGTGHGYDLELTSRVAKSVSIPVIASGGAGNSGHVADVIHKGRADAVSAASLFHYAMLDELESLHQDYEEGNTEFLKGNLPLASHQRKCITATDPAALKRVLIESGIHCRKIRNQLLSGAGNCTSAVQETECCT